MDPRRRVGVGTAGMACDVGQRLLRHAIDNQLGLRIELGELLVDRLGHAQPRRLGEAVAQHRQGADESEVVERLGAELERDPADVLEARANAFLDDRDLVVERRLHAGPDPSEAEQDRRQLLPDLVMQLLRDPQPFGLLAREHTPGGIAPLGLEPGEHLVDGERKLTRFDGGLRARHPFARLSEVDAVRASAESAPRAGVSTRRSTIRLTNATSASAIARTTASSMATVENFRGSRTSSVTTTAVTSKTAFIAATR